MGNDLRTYSWRKIDSSNTLETKEISNIYSQLRKHVKYNLRQSYAN